MVRNYSRTRRIRSRIPQPRLYLCRIPLRPRHRFPPILRQTLRRRMLRPPCLPWYPLIAQVWLVCKIQCKATMDLHRRPLDKGGDTRVHQRSEEASSVAIDLKHSKRTAVFICPCRVYSCRFYHIPVLTYLKIVGIISLE
jgi:hypothetical protein